MSEDVVADDGAASDGEEDEKAVEAKPKATRARQHAQTNAAAVGVGVKLGLGHVERASKLRCARALDNVPSKPNAHAQN